VQHTQHFSRCLGYQSAGQSGMSRAHLLSHASTSDRATTAFSIAITRKVKTKSFILCYIRNRVVKGDAAGILKLTERNKRILCSAGGKFAKLRMLSRGTRVTPSERNTEGCLPSASIGGVRRTWEMVTSFLYLSTGSASGRVVFA